MAPELFKVNANNIVGGAGRLLTAPYGVKLPEKIADVMSLETYELTAPWKDLGATQEGITVSRSYEEEGTEVDQVQGEVETSITKWEHTLATLLAENTIENRQLSLIGSKIIETAPKYGTAVKSANALAAGASLIALATAPGAEFKAGSYLKVGNEIQKISQISGNTLVLEGTLGTAYTTAADVMPLKELGSKRIGYGTVSTAPLISVVLISKKKDGTLAMLVIPKAKVSGESKEQKWSKEKRTLPFALKAFAQDNMPMDSNVYYEIEETLL